MVAERSGLIHVNPDTVNIEAGLWVEETVKFTIPEGVR